MVWEKRLERYMFVVGICGNLMPFVQLAEILAKSSAKDVSLSAYLLSVWALVSWLTYGIVKRDKVIIAANVVGVIGDVLCLTAIVVYG